MQGKRLLKVQEKYYIVDHGFNQALLDKKDEDWGRLLENIVYNELLRRGYEITVGKVNGYEIDFVCKKPNKKIYVTRTSYFMEDPSRLREKYIEHMMQLQLILMLIILI